MGTISDSLKKYFEEATKEEIEKDWEELKYWNEIGPDASEYIEHYRGLKETIYTCDNCPHNGNLICCHNCPNF